MNIYRIQVKDGLALFVLINVVTWILYPPPRPPATEQHVAVKAENAASSEAFQYYTSGERHRLLQDLIDTVQAWMENDLVSKNGAPMYAYDRVWPNKRVHDGYGVLSSKKAAREVGEFSVAVTVLFRGGKPDFSAGIVRFDIYQGDKSYMLEGGAVLGVMDTHLVEDSSTSYSWSVLESNADFSKKWWMRIIGLNGDTPMGGISLPPSNYGIWHEAPELEGWTTIQDIKRLDADFIAQVEAALSNN